MKNRKIVFLQNMVIAVFLMLLAACNYLDIVPEKNATVEYAFGERKRAWSYLATCYSFLPNMAGENTNPGRTASPESYMFKRTDGEYPQGFRIYRGGNNKVNPLINYWDGGNGITSGTVTVNGVKESINKDMFTALRCCNVFLESIDLVPDMDSFEKAVWAAEVKFLKAYYHWWLMQLYGPIPTIRETLPLDATTEEVMVFRDPMDETMEYIIQLLDEAIPNLPDRELEDILDLGRITKPVAMAVKAKIMTCYASPFYNGNTNSTFANFSDKRGIKLFPARNDNKWQMALTACKEAINYIESLGRHRLYNHVFEHEPTLSDSMKLSLIPQTVMTEPYNSDIIWAGRNIDTRQLYQDCFPRMDASTSNATLRRAWSPTLWSVEQFYSANGVPIDEDRDWSNNGWYADRYTIATGDAQHKMFIAQFEQTARLHFNREYRFYGSVGFDRGRWYGAQSLLYNENTQVTLKMRGDYPDPLNALAGTEINGKIGSERFFINGYCGKKIFSYRASVRGSTWGDLDHPWPLMRLADLYLLYAEARNEVLATPDDSVYVYINKVREHVGLKTVQESWSNHSVNPVKYTNKSGMREIIHQERVNELMYEGQLYFDFRRWSCGDFTEKYDIMTLCNAPIRGWNVDGYFAEDYYVLRTIYVPAFSERDLLWPVKEATIVENTNLVQNPGW